MSHSQSAEKIRNNACVARRAFLPGSPGGPGGFDSAKNGVHLRTADRLQELLYLLLETEPVVQAYEPMSDGAVEVRYWGGRVLAAALPTMGSGRNAAILLRRDHARAGRRMVLVPERRLNRPMIRENRRMIADCGHAALRPVERAVVVEALLERNGSAELGDISGLLSGSVDPVAAVLAMVPKGILQVAMDRPIDGRSIVSLFDPFVSAR